MVSAVSKPYLHELEYIESTGIQWIDSGYIPNKNTEITAKIAFSEDGYEMGILGCIVRDGDKYSSWHFGVLKTNWLYTEAHL